MNPHQTGSNHIITSHHITHHITSHHITFTFTFCITSHSHSHSHRITSHHITSKTRQNTSTLSFVHLSSKQLRSAFATERNLRIRIIPKQIVGVSRRIGALSNRQICAVFVRFTFVDHRPRFCRTEQLAVHLEPFRAILANEQPHCALVFQTDFSGV